jgi:hypothetical protein
MPLVTKQDNLYIRRKHCLFSGSRQTQKGINMIEWKVVIERGNVQSTANHYIALLTHITQTNVF